MEDYFQKLQGPIMAVELEIEPSHTLPLATSQGNKCSSAILYPYEFQINILPF